MTARSRYGSKRKTKTKHYYVVLRLKKDVDIDAVRKEWQKVARISHFDGEVTFGASARKGSYCALEFGHRRLAAASTAVGAAMLQQGGSLPSVSKVELVDAWSKVD